MLDLELMQKRAAWKQGKARASVFRSLSFLFLFLVIGGALFGVFLFYTSERPTQPAPESAALSPATLSPTPSAAPSQP